MNDLQIRTVFTEGNNISGTVGLRAVYDAGRNHENWLIAEEDKAIAAAKDAAVAAGVVFTTAHALHLNSPADGNLAAADRRAHDAKLEADAAVKTAVDAAAARVKNNAQARTDAIAAAEKARTDWIAEEDRVRAESGVAVGPE